MPRRVDSCTSGTQIASASRAHRLTAQLQAAGDVYRACRRLIENNLPAADPEEFLGHGFAGELPNVETITQEARSHEDGTGGMQGEPRQQGDARRARGFNRPF